MKKSISVFVSLLMLLNVFSVFAAAADNETVNAYVTISDASGNLVATQESVVVKDIDGDGALTVNDALYAAHEAKYEGGAAAGYESYIHKDYGLSLKKLWGVDNGGSYGYYVNNASAWSLADPVKEGDYVQAFIYTDTVKFSDKYCFFDKNTGTAQAGEEIALTLSYADYDADYNPITLPLKNAVITINGERTDFKTDENGNVALKLSNAGTYTISAVSDSQTLVPPVCTLTITAKSPADDDITNTPETDDTEIDDTEIDDTESNIPENDISDTETPTEDKTENRTEDKTENKPSSTASSTDKPSSGGVAPKTGDSTNTVACIAVIMLSATGLAISCGVRKKTAYEE